MQMRYPGKDEILTSNNAQLSRSSSVNEKKSDGVDRKATRFPPEITQLSRIAAHRVSIVVLEYQYWFRLLFSFVWSRNLFCVSWSFELSSLRSTLSSFDDFGVVWFDLLREECLLDISFSSFKSTTVSSGSGNEGGIAVPAVSEPMIFKFQLLSSLPQQANFPSYSIDQNRYYPDGLFSVRIRHLSLIEERGSS